MALECAPPAHRGEHRVEGAGELRRGWVREMGGFQKGKKKLLLSNEQQLGQETPPFPSYSLSALSSCTLKFLLNLFFRLPPSERRRRGRLGRGWELPQQQRKAGWLALPAQRREETDGHVELSYVLICPSPPPSPPNFFFDTARGGERE